jgi:ribosome-binding protein aMBF1 (putative translation factor)
VQEVVPARLRPEIKRLLKQARQRRGVSLEELAALTRRKVATLRAYERVTSAACPGYRLGLVLAAVLEEPALTAALQAAALASLGLA